jgi:hypothetical protein
MPKINGHPMIYAIVEQVPVTGDVEENAVLNWEGNVIGEFSPVAQHMDAGSIVAEETVIILKDMCHESGYTPEDMRHMLQTVVHRLQLEMEEL